jgi:hypothetical protein
MEEDDDDDDDKYWLTEKATRLQYKDQSVNVVSEIIPLFISRFKLNPRVQTVG